MYNVQAKGPKGQKITFETKIDDPHKLTDIVDPVFSGEVQLQGIKHRYISHLKHTVVTIGKFTSAVLWSKIAIVREFYHNI